MPLLDTITSLSASIEYKQKEITFGKRQQQDILKRMGGNMKTYADYITYLDTIHHDNKIKYESKKITEATYKHFLQAKEDLIQTTQTAYRTEMQKDEMEYQKLQKGIDLLNSQIQQDKENIHAAMIAHPEETKELRLETAIYIFENSHVTFYDQPIQCENLQGPINEITTKVSLSHPSSKR